MYKQSEVPFVATKFLNIVNGITILNKVNKVRKRDDLWQNEACIYIYIRPVLTPSYLKDTLESCTTYKHLASPVILQPLVSMRKGRLQYCHCFLQEWDDQERLPSDHLGIQSRKLPDFPSFKPSPARSV